MIKIITKGGSFFNLNLKSDINNLSNEFNKIIKSSFFYLD